MVDGNAPKVSFDAVGDSFSKVFRLSSSQPRTNIYPFGFDPLSGYFTEKTQQSEIHF